MDSPARPSWVWGALALSAGLLALASAGFALVHQRAADRPVGEGALFAADGAAAGELLDELMAEGYQPGVAIRHLRNALTIEAVSLATPDGVVVESTSETIVGSQITNRHLLFGIESTRLTALARRIEWPINIDGVVEWEPGDILYDVVQPFEGGAILLSYDMQELLERRARAGGVDPLTIQALGAAAVLVLLTIVLLVGRSRVVRRNREMYLEAQLLREHSRELESANARLREARRSAEEALALAEEKNRIRAEFVLMINHELRTPLTAIVTGAELLGGDDSLDPGERSRLVADMIADGRRLEALIGRILEVARIENRGLSLDLSPHSAEEACRVAAEANARITHTPTDPAGLRVRTHLPTLVQLLGSLADNAVTHGATTVTLSASDAMPVVPIIERGERPDPGVFYAVTDDGPGIDPEFLPRIFEKFEKKGFNSGTGLGLYLAVMMAQALGGSLAVDTSPEGTTMVVAVPAAVAVELGDAA